MCLLTRKAHGYSERGREREREGGKEEDKKTKLREYVFFFTLLLWPGIFIKLFYDSFQA